ncbi:protein Mpv17-like [Coccinella septempunctata]|uniref:protein Mpv17-like n=1 Tax=Coccinella septempunctata TaxID=41139 RepID=UPI001D08E458|nr:protein Mpv17-like [Coccinella septempunctata]
MSKFFRSYGKTLQKYPIVVQSIQVGFLMSAGDAIAQKCFEQRVNEKPFDYERNRNFLLLGTFIIGPSSSVWFSVLDRYIKGRPAERAIKKVICDQFIFAPCFLAVFLMLLETMKRRSITEARKAVGVYYFDILKVNYAVWPFVQLCNFYLIPVNYQTLFVQCIALGWNIYISYKSHAK